MCGRFGASYRDLKTVWNLHGEFSFQKRYNIAPSQEVPVIIRKKEGRNEAKVMSWGLVPSWAPDASMAQRMINARSETLLEKPSFRQAVQKRRCLIPANGFYEWRYDGKREKFRCGSSSRPVSLLPFRAIALTRQLLSLRATAGLYLCGTF